MTDAKNLEKIIYSASGSGAQEKTTITDSAGNAVRVSREYDRGMQAHPEKYLLTCKGAAGLPITPKQFLSILDTLDRYDTKLPWKPVGDGNEKLYYVPNGLLFKKHCPKQQETAADL